MTTNRRTFLRVSSIATAALPLLALRELVRPPRRDLPRMRAGDTMRSSSWNDLVDRVNLLSQP